MARPAVELAATPGSSHKRTRSNPFKILVSGPKPQAAGRSMAPSKESPKKTLSRSQTDVNLAAALRGDGRDGSALKELDDGQQRHRLNRQPPKGASLHHRTKSAVSLRSMAGGDKPRKEGEGRENPLQSLSKRSKSSTSLAALFSRPKSRGRKNDAQEGDYDKENEDPTPAPAPLKASPPPIWAQFASANREDGVSAAALATNIGSSLDYRSPATSSNPNNSRFEPATNACLNDCYTISGESRRGSRVRDVVAALDRRAMQQLPPSSPSKLQPLNVEAVETAFEALLEARNIPPDVREKMRTMETSVKADFVDNSQHAGSPLKDMGNPRAPPSPVKPSSPMKRSLKESAKIIDPSTSSQHTNSSPKKSRPRSLTLLGKTEQSPTKKAKHGRSGSRARPISIDLPRSWSSTSLNSQYSTDASGRTKGQTQTSPEEFIDYLVAVKRPQDMEVGRIQKLRQLLRNETVSWVEGFIANGGFEGIVELVLKIIRIEWREEHEDTLLHHSLSCVKALTTTSSGLEHLAAAQGDLFPALLELLFSSGEEKKGPSEFTTRGLIISLLFAYLQCSSIKSPSQRANILLAYLRDPQPVDSRRPPDFMLGMHRERPYRRWIGEISNTTREVFWIFLHHVNVIPISDVPSGGSYLATHFPLPRPPVPAAPYVGSIEWDATNYLATHIDLLNGLIASLETREERNALRTLLRDSGAEKVMGVSLRTCKEKFYSCVHAALATWVAAARADGWADRLVREGPSREERLKGSPAKRRAALTDERPPVLGEINFDQGSGLRVDLKGGSPGLHIMNPDVP